MRILITGITGFLGSHLANYLNEFGYEISGLIRESSNIKRCKLSKNVKLEFIQDNFCNLAIAINKLQPDVVIHTATYFHAAHKYSDINPMINSNLTFGTHLLDIMASNGIKYFVNTGSSWQHFNDSADYRPTCLHSALKQAFEDVIYYYIDCEQIKSVTLYLYDTYGPNDFRSKIFSILERQINSETMLDMSPGEQLLDIVHIDDVCSAYKCALERLLSNESPANERYCVSSGQQISLRNFVEVFELASGFKLNINWGGRAYRSREVMVNWRDGILNVPNWSPQITLFDGIRSILALNDQSC